MLNPPHLSWINIGRPSLSFINNQEHYIEANFVAASLLFIYGKNLFLSTLFTGHNSERPILTFCICDKGSKQSGKVEVLPFLAVCHLSGFRSKFWILLLCLTAFASPHLSWINFDNDHCLRSTMRTMGCCLSYFNIVGAFFFSVIENEVP